MTRQPPAVDILLSQRFVPESGGSIRWMYEVYRRWPRPVELITHDYYNAPPNTPEFPVVPPPPDGRDHVTDVNLKMDRRDIFMNDWGMDRPGKVLRYGRMTRAVGQRLSKHGRVYVYCTHAVPEVVSLIPLRWRYGGRLKIICYAHGEEITACRSSRQLRFLMNRANAVVDLMIVNSSYTASLVGEHIDSKRVSVVHPGVEIARFANAQEAGRRWRRDNDLEGKLVVLTVARLDPRKNHAAVLNAIAQLAPTFDDLVYIMVGQGRQLEALKEQAARLGIADRVVFAGAVEPGAILAMYGGCDVFAMPAIQDGTDVEGFGMVFLEAGACGKPSVAGNVGGQAQAVVDGQTGFVIDGTDQEAVTASLEKLLSDASLRQRLGAAGLTHAKRFDWANVVQQTVRLVEEKVDHPTPGSGSHPGRDARRDPGSSPGGGQGRERVG